MKKIIAALFTALLACAGLAILPGCGKCGEKKECREKKRPEAKHHELKQHQEKHKDKKHKGACHNCHKKHCICHK